MQVRCLKDDSLTEAVLNIIRRKATEMPHTGEYNTYQQSGSYLCRGCGRALFRADSKFTSGCGWPSFDVAVTDAVVEKADADQIRMEILCAYCEAHLGHVFYGEKITSKNKRYCVNSLSLDFVPNTQVLKTEEAIVAGGCFWGVEYQLSQLSGVLKTEVGYIGGTQASPSYQDVCSGMSGHFEAVRILYTPTELSYASLLKYFFEIHDPSQQDGQGFDKGSQYKSAIFYHTEEQKNVAIQLINQLKTNGYSVATQVLAMKVFWCAESYHQDYCIKNTQISSCHTYVKRF